MSTPSLEPDPNHVNEPVPARRWSERALDSTAFFLADTADGLGPFLIIDLTARRGWHSADAGLAMSMLLLGTVLSQAAMGAWIDQTRRKTTAIAVAAIYVAFASAALYGLESKLMIYGVQFLTGVAVTVFPPAVAAISLGLVGRKRLPQRAGRNEACFHTGNVVAALVAIAANHVFGSAGIFFAVSGMAIACAISTLLIRSEDIDENLARGADGVASEQKIIPWQQVFRDRRLLCFALAVVLFHFANAAMLPLVGQKVGHDNPSAAQTLMATCIIVAQIAMIPVAIIAGKAASFRRWPVLLVAFAILPVRGWLYTLTVSPTWLITIQVLDAVGAGIFGVVAILMIADLTKGSGRFNLAQGVIATAIGLGAAASNYSTGLVVDRWGYNAGFVMLSAIACLALIVFVTLVRESADPDDQHLHESFSNAANQ